ncbi:MAG: citrate/2-methylcitrate synthase [Spirochaetota bacterium]
MTPSRRAFPSVDFYSGPIYRSMGIPHELCGTSLAVSRVSGLTRGAIDRGVQGAASVTHVSRKSDRDVRPGSALVNPDRAAVSLDRGQSDRKA